METFRGIGTIVNAIAVIAGGAIGILLKKGFNKRIQDILMQGLGLATIFIGLAGALSGLLSVEGGNIKSQGTMLLIASLVIGSFLGEIINIEQHLENFGGFLKRKVGVQGDNSFVDGFVNTSLVICIGAMGVIGAFQDGLSHDPTMLFTKAILDFVIVMIFASTLGIGTIFSSIPLFLYQGILTLLAGILSPLMNDLLIGQISYVGSVLIFGIGVNLAFGKRLRIGNMIPALLIPVLWNILQKLF